MVGPCFVVSELDVNATTEVEKETKAMLNWLKKTLKPTVTLIIRGGDLLVLYPHNTKTGE